MAGELHFRHYLCSEAVLTSLARAIGMDSFCIPRIATPFGAGMARKGETCGCLTGALMAIGLAYGRSHPEVQMDPKERHYANFCGQNLWEAFVGRFHYSSCRDLIGCDLQTEEGHRSYVEQNLWNQLCRELIIETVSMAYTIIESSQSTQENV
jgi:C_GCAxxG_C_C family probable redox protein